MGLTLHYSGKLTNPDRVSALTDELADICRSNGWEYQLLDKVLPGVPADYLRLLDEGATEYRARGISFQVHEQAESTVLCFGPAGRTLSPMALFRPDLTDWNDDTLAHCTFTKTQLAGPEAHIVLCNLLRYVFGKYFAVVEVNDEGKYYHTEDRLALARQFGAYDEVYAQVSSALAGAGLEKATSIPELMAMLREALPDAEIRLVSGDEEE